MPLFRYGDAHERPANACVARLTWRPSVSYSTMGTRSLRIAIVAGSRLCAVAVCEIALRALGQF